MLRCIKQLSQLFYASYPDLKYFIMHTIGRVTNTTLGRWRHFVFKTLGLLILKAIHYLQKQVTKLSLLHKILKDRLWKRRLQLSSA